MEASGRGAIIACGFYSCLEKSGYIIEVDFYVWEQVFKFLSQQIKGNLAVVPISLNVSRLHTFRVDFEERLFHLASQYDIDPAMIILELTESSFIENAETLFLKVHELQKKGFRISMDDFGSGYSSLNMLKDEPVDEIKIDRLFLSDISTKKSRIIIKRVIELIKELDLPVVAEGVETEEQEEFLYDCGCYQCQGYYFYRPMPATDFFRLLSN